MRRLRLTIILLGLLVAACGGGSSGGSGGSGSVALKAGNVGGLGTVLVDATGRTLYVFAPDRAKKVTCTGQCAAVWSPLKLASGQKPTLSGGVEASLVSSAPDPSGGSVVTYKGWPLYLYAADTGPGMAQGQAMNSSGGLWYAITPTGNVIKKKGGAGAHSGSSRY